MTEHDYIMNLRTDEALMQDTDAYEEWVEQQAARVAAVDGRVPVLGSITQTRLEPLGGGGVVDVIYRFRTVDAPEQEIEAVLDTTRPDIFETWYRALTLAAVARPTLACTNELLVKEATGLLPILLNPPLAPDA